MRLRRTTAKQAVFEMRLRKTTAKQAVLLQVIIVPII